jgi:hypothetical protein
MTMAISSLACEPSWQSAVQISASRYVALSNLH